MDAKKLVKLRGKPPVSTNQNLDTPTREQGAAQPKPKPKPPAGPRRTLQLSLPDTDYRRFCNLANERFDHARDSRVRLFLQWLNADDK